MISEDEIPFDIPETWEWVRFGNLIQLLSGRDLTPSEYSETPKGIPYITGASNIKNGNIIINRWTETPLVIALKGDLLISCKGTIGEMAFLREKEVHIARQIMGIRISLLLNPYFVKFFLETSLIHLRVSAKSLIPGISRDDVTQLLFPLPPLAEQSRIVAKIEELLPKIAEYGEAQERLAALNAEVPDKLRKSILQQAVQGKLTDRDPSDEPASLLLDRIRAEKARLIKEGKLREQRPLPPVADDEIPFDIPETWEWVRLGEILESTPRNGYSPKPVSYQTSIKTLTLTATTSGIFKPEAFKYIDEIIPNDSYLWLQNGDILIQRSNSLDYVGTSCIYTGEDHAYIYPDLIMKMRVVFNISNDYIHRCLQTHYNRLYFQKHASGSSKSMPKINQATVVNCLIPLPPLAEQARIVERVETLLAKCSDLK